MFKPCRKNTADRGRKKEIADSGNGTLPGKTKSLHRVAPVQAVWWICTQKIQPSLCSFVNSFQGGFRVSLCWTRRTYL